MEPIYGQLSSIAVTLGALAGVYVHIRVILARIETRLEIDDARRSEVKAGQERDTKLLLVQHCEKCPVMEEHRQWAEPSVVTAKDKP